MAGPALVTGCGGIIREESTRLRKALQVGKVSSRKWQVSNYIKSESFGGAEYRENCSRRENKKIYLQVKKTMEIEKDDLCNTECNRNGKKHKDENM